MVLNIEVLNTILLKVSPVGNCYSPVKKFHYGFQRFRKAHHWLLPLESSIQFTS